MITQLAFRLTAPVQQSYSVSVFCKALIVFVVLKAVLSWSIVNEIWYGESRLLFYQAIIILSVPVAIYALIRPPNYVVALVMTWFAFKMYWITFAVANGSDQIAACLLLFSIPLSAHPVAGGKGAVFTSGLYHGAHLFSKIFVVMIYFISGVDKLGSEAWRSGDAMTMIGQLDFLINPNLADFMPKGDTANMILSWITIAFELSFAVLVWFRPIRKWILLCGVIFHLVIGVFMSLPDFAVIMMVAYLIFLNDDDYTALRTRFIRHI